MHAVPVQMHPNRPLIRKQVPHRKQSHTEHL